MDAGPDQPAVGVDVHLGHAEFGGGEVLVFIHTARGWIQFPAGAIDPLDFFDRHAGAAVHHDRRPGNAFLDSIDDIEVQTLFSLEFIGAVARADGGGERIATCLLYELHRFIRIGQGSVTFIDRDVLLHPAELAQFGLDADAFLVRAIHHAFGDGDIFGERLVARVDHDRTVKTRVNAIVAGLLVTMIEMHGKDRVLEHFFRRADQRLEHPFVGVLPRAFRKLDNERRLALHVAAEQPEDLFHVVHVVSADGKFSVGDLIELFGGNDHGGMT